MDEMTFTLNSPITEEQWDVINDVDFEHTNEITFHTKHGKEVKFVKAPAQPKRNYAQSIGKCETCYYWGNRIMMRDGSLGDCGNFGVSLSKDFFCAWWPQKEKEGEQDG